MDSRLTTDSSQFESRHLVYQKNYRCRPDFRSKWIRNKGAILVLVWGFLCLSVYQYFVFSDTSRDPMKGILKMKVNSGYLIGIAVVLPIGGWLADAYFGRYRVIRCGMWIMWVGAMLNGLSLMVGKIADWYSATVDPWISLVSKVIMGVGLGAFQANIIPFGIDQLIDASSTEVTAFIMWYTILVFFCGFTTLYSSSCSGEYVAVVVIAFFLTLALSLNLICHRWLNKEQLISNPLPQILKVLHFTIKNGSRSRGRMLSRQHGFLSRFNVAKKLYNGPFTHEQVEDVKTFLRVVTLIVTVTVLCSGIPTVEIVKDKLTNHLRNYHQLKGCYERLSIRYFQYTFPLLVAPVYQIFVRPLFRGCVPHVSITFTVSLSVLLYLASLLCLLGIESVSYYDQVTSNHTTLKCTFQEKHFESNVKFYWTLLPSALMGLSTYIFILSGLEFICAQAPFNMKGLVLGITYGLYGLMSLVHSAISIPFVGPGKHTNVWKNAPLTCGIWYFMIQGVITLVGFIVVMVMAKMYKRRKRISLLSPSDLQGSVS